MLFADRLLTLASDGFERHRCGLTSNSPYHIYFQTGFEAAVQTSFYATEAGKQSLMSPELSSQPGTALQSQDHGKIVDSMKTWPKAIWRPQWLLCVEIVHGQVQKMCKIFKC